MHISVTQPVNSTAKIKVTAGVCACMLEFGDVFLFSTKVRGKKFCLLSMYQRSITVYCEYIKHVEV